MSPVICIHTFSEFLYNFDGAMETPHRGNVSPRKCLKKRTHKTI